MRLRLPFPSGERFSGSARFIRILAFFVVMTVVAWAFWQQSERTVRELSARQAIADQMKLLSGKDLAFVKEFAANLERRYGLKFRLLTSAEAIAPPDLDQRTLFIGLSPARKEVVIVWPPLLAGALGADFTRYLADEHFTPYLAAGDTSQGLVHALALIWDRLGKLPGHNEKP
jgi:hypothetical protein